MTDKTELKRLAQRVIDIEALDGEQPISAALDEFQSAANPEAVLALIAENDQLCVTSQYWKDEHLAANSVIDQPKAENEALCAKFANLKVSGFSEAFYTVAAALGITGARPLSPMQVFQSEILPALEAAVVDAKRYRFFRENSLRIIHASSQCWVQRLEKAIDDAMTEVSKP